MDRDKDPYHHGDLRNALVQAASQLVQAGGAESFSLREAARSVGVSANAAYRHFADKSALLTAVALAGFGELARRMQRAQRAAAKTTAIRAGALAQFKAVGQAYVEFAVDYPHWFRVMFGVNGLCRFAGDPLLAPRPSPYELLAATLDDLVGTGALSTGARAGAELKAWTVVHGFASLILDGGISFRSKTEQTAALKSLLEFAVAGLSHFRPADRGRYR